MSAVTSMIEDVGILAKIKDNVLGTAGQKGDLQGRSVTHWSFWVFIAGSIVGLIVAVVAIIFGIYPAVVTSFLLSATNGLAAFYIKRLGVIKDLDQYDKNLKENMGKLKKVDDNIGKTDEDLKKINTDLQSVPTKLQEEIEKGKQEITQKVSEIETLTKKLGDAEGKIANLAAVARDLNHATGDLSQEMLKFGEDNNAFSGQVKEIGTEMNELKENNDKIVKEILTIDADKIIFTKMNEDFAKQIGTFGKMFNLMKDMYKEAHKEMDKLHQEVSTLKTVIPETAQTAEKIQEVEQKYEKVLQQLKIELAGLKNLQAAKKELETLKASQEWKQFQAWKATQKQTKTSS